MLKNDKKLQVEKKKEMSAVMIHDIKDRTRWEVRRCREIPFISTDTVHSVYFYPFFFFFFRAFTQISTKLFHY